MKIIIYTVVTIASVDNVQKILNMFLAYNFYGNYNTFRIRKKTKTKLRLKKTNWEFQNQQRRVIIVLYFCGLLFKQTDILLYLAQITNYLSSSIIRYHSKAHINIILFRKIIKQFYFLYIHISYHFHDQHIFKSYISCTITIHI